MDEFKSSWIIRVRNFKRVLVNIHKVVSLKVHHKSRRGSLVGSHILGIVMIFLGAFKCLTEQRVHFGLVFFRNPVSIQFLNCFLAYVGNVARQVLFLDIVHVAFIGESLRDCYSVHHLHTCYLFLFWHYLFFRLQARPFLANIKLLN